MCLTSVILFKFAIFIAIRRLKYVILTEITANQVSIMTGYTFSHKPAYEELFRNQPQNYQLVITDMTMPFMTGMELSSKLKKIRSDIPVIVCTGHSTVIEENKTGNQKIDGYLLKPVSMTDLSQQIRKILDQ